MSRSRDIANLFNGSSQLGYVTSTTTQLLTSSNSNLLSLTITAPGTPIIISAGFSLYSYSYATPSANYTDCIFDLYSSTNTALSVPIGKAYSNITTYGFDQIGSEQITPVLLQTRINPTAGSLTIQLRGRNIGTGDAEFHRSGNPPAWMRVSYA